MRSIGTLIGAAFLLAVVIFIVLWFADGYFGASIVPADAKPNAWAAPDSWHEWRDIVIVFMGLFWVLAGILACAVMVALLFLVLMVRRVLRENVAPAVDSLKESLDNVKGTTEFAGETVASPIIRAYSVVKGVRTGLGAIGGIGDRVRRNRKKK
ncbi:MAG: hypothetical protein IT303_14615 [Dehalococcoidia bacterium]|nr:hypothetical protein [Dehalococcoidia bacterium]